VAAALNERLNAPEADCVDRGKVTAAADLDANGITAGAVTADWFEVLAENENDGWLPKLPKDSGLDETLAVGWARGCCVAVDVVDAICRDSCCGAPLKLDELEDTV